jgi:hypothetical protein
MNHVHIELNLRGAAKKTTFWNKNISYDVPVEDEPTPQPPTQPQPQPQPEPEPQDPHPWNGNGQTGGGQYDSTGGTWGQGWN